MPEGPAAATLSISAPTASATSWTSSRSSSRVAIWGSVAAAGPSGIVSSSSARAGEEHLRHVRQQLAGGALRDGPERLERGVALLLGDPARRPQRAGPVQLDREGAHARLLQLLCLGALDREKLGHLLAQDGQPL